MKLLRLSATLSATVISFLPVFHASVSAQEPDYVCFLTTKAGQVVDLTDSVCGSNKSTTAVPVNTDQAFMKDYERSVMEYPEVRDSLLASAQESPEQSISEAKRICNNLKAGVSSNEIQKNQAEEADEKASIVNAAIINTLATKYYCPEVSNE